MGKFGKGISNSNGKHPFEYAMQNDLVLTNTFFPHKMDPRTTWASHKKVEDRLSSDGTSRRNPYRKQFISSVKTCTKSFCRNQDHMVEEKQKLITNWLKLILD